MDVFSEYLLNVRPRGSRFTKPLGSSIVLTCEVESATGDVRVTALQWFDGRRSAITETPGRSVIMVYKLTAEITSGSALDRVHN